MKGPVDLTGSSTSTVQSCKETNTQRNCYYRTSKNITRPSNAGHQVCLPQQTGAGNHRIVDAARVQELLLLLLLPLQTTLKNTAAGC
jgi:hypothetical protein